MLPNFPPLRPDHDYSKHLNLTRTVLMLCLTTCQNNVYELISVNRVKLIVSLTIQIRQNITDISYPTARTPCTYPSARTPCTYPTARTPCTYARSFYTSDRFADVPIPPSEDWEAATGEVTAWVCVWVCVCEYCTELYCTALHWSVLYCTALHCMVPCRNVLRRTELHSSMLRCTVLYYTIYPFLESVWHAAIYILDKYKPYSTQ